MFLRINVECAKNRLSIKGLAAKAGIKYDTLLMKLNGHTEFTRVEMLRIQAVFPEKIPLEELFATEDDRKTA